MNPLRPFLAVILAVILIACAAQPLHAATYNANNLFSFTIPSGFVGMNESGNAFPVFVDNPQSFTSYLQISTQDYPDSLISYVQGEMSSFKSAPSLANVQFSGTKTIQSSSGAKGIRVLMNFGGPKGPMEMAGYYFLRPGGMVVILHAFFYQPEASHFLPIYDATAQSVILK